MTKYKDLIALPRSVIEERIKQIEEILPRMMNPVNYELTIELKTLNRLQEVSRPVVEIVEKAFEAGLAIDYSVEEATEHYYRNQFLNSDLI